MLKHVIWPESWPFTEEDFGRKDEAKDEEFYAKPRFCAHADDIFIRSLKRHYEAIFPKYSDARILDLCSSWISHYPEEKVWSHVSITGMNEEELKSNKQADDYIVHNLNADPRLPYKSATFDIVTCAVSFDYLIQPLEVMREVGRVLKPGGMVILSTSNRCFPEKAVKIWIDTSPMEHVLIYASYIRYTEMFEAVEALDLSSLEARGLGIFDPTYVVQARKLGGEDADQEPEDELAEKVEAIPGLTNWLQSRELLRHYDKVLAWCEAMGAADFVEVAENTEDLAEFLGRDLTAMERIRLLRGTH